ncbi:hypothetical protein AKJ56_00120 [candidate division MSBL1 archaeon SCGC-AAA382N08]|uniref:DNA-directed RNA polymerase n=1 Tax=candidate division MSBL1 archaeon SCGC-AAA382N08 TaxID=1698285 RepID=A0A133VR04_9EURY|nr:hypothetical protein AKJ56_00120 [candidate division MSBL1 archaeon SCGC-AAA382N08]
MISLPEKPKVVEKDDNWARLEVEALYPGYGVTIGNSLRRVLLSSLPGAACTEAKIEGAQHEFSTIEGVVEDVVAISLNLKQLKFKLYGEEPQTVELSVEGEQEVTAADLETPTQVEVIAQGAPIATLTDDGASLEMELKVEQGLGYVTSEENKEEKAEAGVLHLDAIFTPVEKVSYDVEDMRVGEATDYNRLIMEIETDGSVTPEEAFIEACGILSEHFDCLGEGLEEQKEEKEQALGTEIEDLDISTRTQNILKDNNIKTVAGLVRRREETVADLEGMGDKSMKEIEKALRQRNLEFK